MKTNKNIEEFIQNHAHLFWYTPKDKLRDISEELLLEQVLNYTDIPTIKEYFDLIGLANAKRIFYNLQGRKAHNIYPEIYNLFDNYFKRHA